MPKYLTQYRVFIASPSGLDAERKLFRDTLEKYNRRDAEPRGVTFLPVGWEDTIGGAGRPQELINEDLKQCDFAVFVLHDRWGSPTGLAERGSFLLFLLHFSGARGACLLSCEVSDQAMTDGIALDISITALNSIIQHDRRARNAEQNALKRGRKMTEIGLFDATHTARALRRFKPDAVPDEAIAKVIDAGVRAPTGSNLQNWRFVVVKDQAVRQQLGDLYRASIVIAQKVLSYRERPAHMTQKLQRQMYAAQHLADHFEEVPVLLLAWLKLPPDEDNPNLFHEEAQTYLRLSGASIYGAIQNMILACRVLGLGTVLTTVLAYKEAETRKLLGASPDMKLFAVLPISYPVEGHGHGPVRRLPISDVACVDGFIQNWSAK